MIRWQKTQHPWKPIRNPLTFLSKTYQAQGRCPNPKQRVSTAIIESSFGSKYRFRDTLIPASRTFAKVSRRSAYVPPAWLAWNPCVLSLSFIFWLLLWVQLSTSTRLCGDCIYVHSFTPRHAWIRCLGNALDSCRGCGCKPWQTKISKTLFQWVADPFCISGWAIKLYQPKPQAPWNVRPFWERIPWSKLPFEGPSFSSCSCNPSPKSCIINALGNTQSYIPQWQKGVC